MLPVMEHSKRAKNSLTNIKGFGLAQVWPDSRVSVQGVKSLGGHIACLCRGFEFYEVNFFFMLLFFKKKMEILLHF